MTNTTTTSAIALALTVFAAAPAAAQSRVELQMAAELRILQEQTQQLALTLQQLGDAIKAINARIDESNRSTMKGFADQDLRVKQMGTDISAIREGTQDTNTRLGQLRDEVEAMRTSLTSLPALLSQFAAPPAPVDPNADPNAPPPAGAAPAPALPAAPPAVSTLGLSPERMYRTAESDYHAGQYSLAILGFEAYLRQFPRTELADDAHFFMGEAYASEMKFDQAIAAYNQVIQNYPNGDQVPMAYYKRGLAQNRLGQVDAARASWEMVIKLLPSNRSEVALAQQNLDRIKREQQAKPQ